MKKLIVASTSTIHGSNPLEYLKPTLLKFFKDIKELIFIPYARPGGVSYDEYTANVKKAFVSLGIEVKGIHEFAQGIFTGGGNTFELVNQLYKNDIVTILKEVLESGTPYLGTSAGSNICGFSMMNTNDMPIVYPPSYQTLGLLPFNINAHYLDPDTTSTHMGETRETRIKEFHVYNKTSVIGLREGSWLEVIGHKITLQGNLTARVFKQNQIPYEIKSGSEVFI